MTKEAKDNSPKKPDTSSLSFKIEYRDPDGNSKAWVPATMSEGEYWIYIVIAIVCIIGCCVLCCIFKQIILFAIIIAVFVGVMYWYLYFYRNKP